jgi:peptidoglycan/LPS O-acetylase OafA/YrhL
VELGPITILPYTFLTNGWQGVRIFFLLSGFVLFLPYVSGHRVMQTMGDAWSFLYRRAWRLLPLYVFSIAVCFWLVRGVDSVASLRAEIVSIAVSYISTDPATYFPPVNWVLWSHHAEILFSLFFPVFVVGAQRFGIGRLVFVLALVSLLYRVVIVIWSGWAGHPFIPDGILGSLVFFAAGMLLAHLHVHHPALSRSHMWSFAGSILLAGGFMLADFWRLDAISGYANIVVVFLTVASFFCLFLAALSSKPLILRRVLTWWPLQMIGLMSYSIYVWHGVLIAPLGAMSSPLHLLRYVVVLVGVSTLSHLYVEFGWQRNRRLLLPSRAGHVTQQEGSQSDARESVTLTS